MKPDAFEVDPTPTHTYHLHLCIPRPGTEYKGQRTKSKLCKSIFDRSSLPSAIEKLGDGKGSN